MNGLIGGAGLLGLVNDPYAKRSYGEYERYLMELAQRQSGAVQKAAGQIGTAQMACGAPVPEPENPVILLLA